jgi:glutamate racemase
LGAVRTCKLGIYLAAELLQADVPSSLICAIREDAQVRSLAQDVLVRIEEPQDVEPIESQIFNLKLKERVRDKVCYVFLQCTQYSGAEERFLALPSALSFMYIFVRPIWLLRRYGFSVLKRLALSRRDL